MDLCGNPAVRAKRNKLTYPNSSKNQLCSAEMQGFLPTNYYFKVLKLNQVILYSCFQQDVLYIVHFDQLFLVHFGFFFRIGSI